MNLFKIEINFIFYLFQNWAEDKCLLPAHKQTRNFFRRGVTLTYHLYHIIQHIICIISSNISFVSYHPTYHLYHIIQHIICIISSNISFVSYHPTYHLYHIIQHIICIIPSNILFIQKECSKMVFIDEAGKSTAGWRWKDVIGERVPKFDYSISEQVFNTVYGAKGELKFELWTLNWWPQWICN